MYMADHQLQLCVAAGETSVTNLIIDRIVPTTSEVVGSCLVSARVAHVAFGTQARSSCVLGDGQIRRLVRDRGQNFRSPMPEIDNNRAFVKPFVPVETLRSAAAYTSMFLDRTHLKGTTLGCFMSM